MADIKYTEDGYPYYEAALGDTPLATAAKSFFNPVGPTKRLPVKDQYKPTTYIMEPDLMEAQTGKLNVPDDVGFDEAGAAYNTVTGEPVQVIRRPNVLPIAPTPDGYTFAMPKMLDVVGNVMGNVGGLAGGKIAANAGEMVLGSGAVRTMRNPNKIQIENLINKSEHQELRGLIDDSGVHVWDASKSTHHDTAKELGINYDINNRIHITKPQDEKGFYTLDFDDKWRNPELVKSNPNFVRLLNQDNILVNEPGQGLISGKDFLKLYSDTRPQVTNAIGHAVEKQTGPFYSALERTVENAKISKADAQQWLGYLKNQPGVKQEELAYVLKDLPEGQISKEALADIIKNNKVELKEVVKKHDKNFENLDADEAPQNLTKYHSYQLPGGPLSRDTEILTKTGWKRIDNVSIGEEIITRKDENGELEWQPILAIPNVYAEKLYHFYNQSIDMQVTANHKMVVRKRRRSNRGIFRITAEQLWKTSECVIPLTGNWTGEGSKILFGYDACDAAEFIGWYLSEGSYKHKNGVKNTIQISQCRNHNPDNCDRLEALFDRMGVAWKYYGNGYGIGSKSLNKEFLKLLHDQPNSEGKFIPNLFFNENKHVINSLLAGLILGDGHHSEEGYDDYGSFRQARKIFFSKSKLLADGVQILALLSGYRASVRKRPTGIYCVGINLKEWNSVDDSKYAIIDYHDFAYCVTVKNHCIYVRRNGVAAFTGNSDYQEMLLTLPPKTSEAGNAVVSFAKEMNAKYGERWIGKLTLEENKLYDDLINAADNPNAAELQNYKSSHWDEPNILAHVRYNDRDIPDVGKSLHLEEIQSDWHQAGRKNGYKDESDLNKFNELDRQLQDARSDLAQAAIDSSQNSIGMSWQKFLQTKPTQGAKDAALAKIAEYRKTDNRYLDTEARVKELEEARARANPANKVPDAPFKKNWDELAFKRMLHKAAVEGYDSISWTPGEAQAARYDLSKQLKELQYLKNDDGTYQIAGITAKGDGFNHPENVTAVKLPDIVGKEMAEKIIKNEGKRNRGHPANGGYFEGVDLKIGGEGMKAFYDKMLVDKANALAKKFGGKVETKFIKGKGKITDLNYEDQPVHVLKLTPELKARAKQGFPLFSQTPVLNPVSFNPFEEKKPKYRLTPILGNPFQ